MCTRLPGLSGYVLVPAFFLVRIRPGFQFYMYMKLSLTSPRDSISYRCHLGNLCFHIISAEFFCYKLSVLRWLWHEESQTQLNFSSIAPYKSFHLLSFCWQFHRGLAPDHDIEQSKMTLKSFIVIDANWDYWLRNTLLFRAKNCVNLQSLTNLLEQNGYTGQYRPFSIINVVLRKNVPRLFSESVTMFIHMETTMRGKHGLNSSSFF